MCSGQGVPYSGMCTLQLDVCLFLFFMGDCKVYVKSATSGPSTGNYWTVP